MADKFRRGAMHFEDYNYELYNKYVLIDPNKGIADEQLEEDEEQPKEKMLGFAPGEENSEGAASKKQPITENLLEQSVHDSYKHNQLDVETEAEKEAANQAALLQRRVEAQQRFDEEEEKHKEEEQERQEKEKENEDGEGDGEGEDGEEQEEEIEYDIYYDQKQIKQALDEQTKDVFSDIL